MRTSRGLQLSDAGKSYYPAVRDALALLAEGTEALAHRRPNRRLSLSVAPTFAARWLLPRLPSFRRSYPQIGIVIDTSRERIDLNGGADLAIRMGHGKWQGLSVHRLLEEALVPVAAPALNAQAHDISRIEQAAFIHVLSISQDWEAWASAVGYPVPDPAKGLRVDTVQMALSAAIEGLGVAIGRRPLIDRDLREGRLVELARAVPSGTSYWLVAEESRSDEPGIAAFRDWIMAVAAASPRQAVHSQGDGTRLGLLSQIATAWAWNGWPAETPLQAAPSAASGALGFATLRHTQLITVYVVYGLVAVGLVPHMVFLVDFMARGLMHGLDLGGWYWVVFGVGALLGPVIAGRLADRIGFANALRCAPMLQVICVALPPVFDTATAALIVSSLFVGGAVSGTVPLALGRTQEIVANSRDRKTAWSVATVVFALGRASAGYLFSYIFAVTGGDCSLLFILGSAAMSLAPIVALTPRGSSGRPPMQESC